MSSTLKWETLDKGKSLDDDLKFLLRKRYGSTVDAILDREDLLYLQGLLDATSEGQQLTGGHIRGLIDLIEKHERIHVWEQF